MPIYTTPVLNINLKKLVENYNLLKALSAPATAAAVVKDDAYGLGAVEVVKALYAAGCKHYFVAHASEGAIIRPYATEAEIFVLQGVGEDSLDAIKSAHLIPVICSPEMLTFWHTNGDATISPAIQIETGLNRLGFTEQDLEHLSREELNSFSYVLSHLSCADEAAHFMNAHQLQNFHHLKQKFFPNTKATLSASDGVFLGDDFHFDMTRLGAAMYGINTAPYRQNEMHNIIELKAPVLQVKPLPKGEFVGYSATFRSPQDMTIAIVSIGYGDGLPRSLSSRGNIVFYEHGKPHFCPILGRVSMDNIICDVTNLTTIQAGDFGYLINDDYTVDDIARDANTIAYELISNLGKNKRFIKSYI
ncbi:MAG: alanine racemase [Acetobacter sp.]|nr:alanine racemase [Acetobacter sp.]